MAGYVDGVGFLVTGGDFVSFMSGNSTRLGADLFRRAPEAAFAASLVGAFIAGVVAGAGLRRVAGRRPETAILAALTAALLVCGLVASQGSERIAAILLAAAMGAENTIFAEAGEVRIGLTYMTGALVKVGKGLAAALFGEPALEWAPYLLLWLGLVSGAAAGAMAYDHFGARAIWFAAAMVALLTPVSTHIFPPRGEDGAGPTRGGRGAKTR